MHFLIGSPHSTASHPRSTTLSRALRCVVLTVGFAGLTACEASDEVLSPEPPAPAARRFQAVWINASWSGGRTGTPLGVKAVSPSSFFGRLCPASSLVMENHSTRFPGFGSTDILVISNNCTIPVLIAVCATAGSGGSGSSLPVCAIDPRKTPLNRVKIARLSGGGQPEPLGQTSRNLDINVFFCSDISTFNWGKVPGADPTDCVDPG